MRGTCLVTGASGYIGGRLIPLLLKRGWQVRVLVRRPESISQRSWHDDVTVIQGDARDAAALQLALEGVDVAYYLMHSIGSGPQFDLTEREVAETFAEVARVQHVGRIVYLGGMAPDGSKLSPHLRSRRSVGEALRSSGVPTIEFRAAVVIGSGSASFEMLRYLTERLPVMVTPLWVRTKTQPIAVRDVLHYLLEAAEVPGDINRDFDIGGPEVMTYQSMMQRFAKVSGLRPRRILPINVLSPGLSSHWVGLITPVPRGVARPLVESLRVPVVCRDHSVAGIIPDPPGGLLSYDRAVAYAIARVRDADVDTRWSGASVVGAPSQPLPSDPDWSGGSLYTDVREVQTTAPPEDVWRVVESIGGDTGYFAGNWMWEIRGAMDRLIGGVGLRRGRRDPVHLRVGDALDFWRVEQRSAPTALRLRAEMRLPGLAWIEWRLEPRDGGCHIQQRALFFPKGLLGHLYWWAVAPFHAFVFGPMLRRMVARAESLSPRQASAVAA